MLKVVLKRKFNGKPEELGLIIDPSVLASQGIGPKVANHYARPKKITAAGKVLTIPEGLQVMIDGNFYQTEQDIPVSAAEAAGAGKDLYLYACKPSDGTVPDFIVSENSTVPDGYDANTSRKIGGFHCLCLAVGLISGHKLSGLDTADIIPNSVWDLLHRPSSEAEGMVWVEPVNRWVDIYLPSWDGSKLVSKFGGVVADGSSAKVFTGENFEEEFKLTANKDLISRAQFQVAARGSNVHTTIAGAADPNTTGGHKDTAGRRCISDYGLEDATGVYWQWAADTYEGGAYGTKVNNQYWLSGYAWDRLSVYNASADGSTDLGSCVGYLRRALLGGFWGSSEASYVGPRSAVCLHASACALGSISGRGVSEPRVVGS